MKIRRTDLPSTPQEYPAGTFVSTEEGYFYIANRSERFRIISERVLESWSPARVVKTTEAAVAKYRVSAKIKFRNGSLIHSIADGKTYLIEAGRRRWVKNPDWLHTLGVDKKSLGFSMGHILVVSQEEVDLHDPGKDLD